MKFNIALLAPIGGTVISLLLWFEWLKKDTPVLVLLCALFLQLMGFIIVLGPDKTDSKTDKDASNWRSFTPFILAIIGIMGLALYKSHV